MSGHGGPPPAPPPPSDPELKNIIDKLAQFVARNGPEFETMTKNKQRDNPKFAFLMTHDPHHAYYNYQVQNEARVMRGGAGPHHAPHHSHPPPPPRHPMGPSPMGGPGPGLRGPPPRGFGGPPPGRFGGPPRHGGPHWGESGPPNMAGSPGWGGYMGGGGGHGPPRGQSPAPSGVVGGPRPLMDVPAYLPGEGVPPLRGNGAVSAPPGSAGPFDRGGPFKGPPPNVSQPVASQPPVASVNTTELREQIQRLSTQQQGLRDQITQSESNLSAQHQVTTAQIETATQDTLKKSRWEHLNLLAGDTGIDMEELETVIHPIVESCTKDSIGSGKSWIFQKATGHDNNKLIAHYLAFRVTQPDAPFSTKLHLMYLMNDVLHHCMRKHAEELKQSFESVAVEMFCGASASAKPDQMPKLDKLIKLWEDKHIFSPSTLNKMRDTQNSWQTFLQELKETYSSAVESAVQTITETYDNYKKQHQNFVNHANSTIQSLEKQKIQLEEQIKAAEEKALIPAVPASSAGLEPEMGGPPPTSNAMMEPSGPWSVDGDDRSKARADRRSRWDTGANEAPPPMWQQQPPPIRPPTHGPPPSHPAGFQGPPPHMGGPPGNGPPPPFGGGSDGPPDHYDESYGPYNAGFPPPRGLPEGPPMFGGQQPPFPPNHPHHLHHPSQQQQLPPPPLAAHPPTFDEAVLKPNLPYYELPAGLMVPLVKLEDSGYKPINANEIRLPPPTPPSERLLQALELFYAPPSHERPRDPEGWEVIGLYEWSRDKTAAIRKKAEAIESGERERSRTASPEPFSARSTPERGDSKVDPKTGGQKADEPPKKKRYRSKSRSPVPSRRARSRSRTRSRSRSRTRSRSRGSTPERGNGRGRDRSLSPTGGYSMPSYLTRRSPSPNGSHGRGRGSPSSRSRSRGGATRRSPSPDESYSGFGSKAVESQAVEQRLDSSNKGHQMMQKMGWKTGSGLGSSESGIVEPISGGEVRDKQDKFLGMGVRSDPFEAFRKAKSGSFYTRMKERDTKKKKK